MKNKFLIIGVICFIVAASYFFFYQQRENFGEEIKVLSVEILEEGSGEIIKEGDRVVVNFNMWLENGTIFESSLEWDEPYVFLLGSGQVIKGMDEGMLGARIGETRRIKIPYVLAYGESGHSLSNGYETVPPKTNFIMDVEILGVQ